MFPGMISGTCISPFSLPMYHNDDCLTADHYLEQAVKFPQSPIYLSRLVARLYANANANADSPEVVSSMHAG